MKDELIFHLVSRDGWRKGQHHGEYIPENIEDEGFIRCWNGAQAEDAANKYYSDTRRLMLVVIDPSRVATRIKYREHEDGSETPCILGPLNIDAVIDKLNLRPDREGHYSIEVETN